MAEDPNHPWGTGATTHSWVPEVRHNVHLVAARWPNVRPNSYVCHPWCGWSRFSVDFWGSGGRGDPLPEKIGPEIRRFLMNLPGPPAIRHTIWEHWIWTSWGGYSPWIANDHSGRLRHLHVTYWR
jgi:hypothetical protein